MTPILKKETGAPDWEVLRQSTKADTPAAWVALGDALTLWGGNKTLDEAMHCYARAVTLDAKHGFAWVFVSAADMTPRGSSQAIFRPPSIIGVRPLNWPPIATSGAGASSRTGHAWSSRIRFTIG